MTATPLKWRPQGDDQDLHLQDDYRGTTTNPPQNCDVGDNAVTSRPHTIFSQPPSHRLHSAPGHFSLIITAARLFIPVVTAIAPTTTPTVSLQNSIDTPFLPTGVLPTPDVASKIGTSHSRPVRKIPTKAYIFIVEMKTFSLM
ncbi:hypothetical protein EDB85DRAFT_2145174 [Lactarius pseudohatsudake]|nr:hypothetical protein EDB85DRAFT_2145174 [Lactarius pseudohatsudake]